MPTRVVVVGAESGLHARPAAMIAAAVGASGHPVTLSVPGGAPVSAASALLIMTLGAECGAPVLVESDDPAAVEEIAELISRGLD